MSTIPGKRYPSKHFLVYKITNKVTGETYIGQHQTYDVEDGYMGSGKILKEKIKELGIEHFKKEILGDYGSFEEMNNAEIHFISLLQPEYNVSLGGESFANINSVPGLNNKAGQYKKAHQKHLQMYKEDSAYKEKCLKAISNGVKKAYEEGKMQHIWGNTNWLGKKHTEEAKRKMSEIKRGKQTTSTLGKHWFTNGKENVVAFECPKGWTKGRS